ncbi:triacylglycerol lipase [Dictyocaulus viviparus]|uniref:Triacylglycerol lipase n=1 Tax=Dictyocaulus viviparus TaxID=29172 RepID=A0A0D8XE90_DICVI|nr:triacylglycerol lipase [Dictyocaulus viviparus]
MIKFDMLFFLLIYQSYAINTLIKYNERFCSQFVNCENCAGRHHDSEFTECVWCPIFNSCISTNSKCRSGYWEKIDCPLLSVQSCIATLPANIELSKRFAIQTSLGERTDGYVAVDHSHQAIIASFSSVAAGKKLFFGHSIGGAKAEMSVLSILFKKLVAQQKVRLLTFGSSRVPYRFRIVHGRDMVPHYPRKFDGEWTPPHHHRYEVWYPNGMRPGDKYIVCLGAEDPQCSSRLSPWEIRAAENDLYFERRLFKTVGFYRMN